LHPLSIASAKDHYMLGVTHAVVSVCGSVVRVLFKGRNCLPPPCGERGESLDMSPQSRKRLLVFMAQIDWANWERGMFLTFGYPDSEVYRCKDQLNRDRFLLHRWMEKYTGVQLKGIWRTEWEVRKSGGLTSFRCPHHHWLMLGCPYIPYLRIRKQWQAIIRSAYDPSFRLSRVNDPKHAGLYVSKYVAKVGGITRLGIPPYLNKPGRHWGFHRKDLIPMHVCLQVNVYDPEIMRTIEEFGAVALPWVNPGEGYSFDVFGEKACQIKQCLVDFGLDKHARVSDTL